MTAGTTGRLGRLEPAVAVLVTALATLSFAAFFAGWWWSATVAGAVLAGGTVAGIAHVRRLRWWVALPGCLLVMALGLMAACYPELTVFGLPTAQALAALGTGLATGVPKMLTVGLPADVSGDLLVAPAALAFVAGAAAVALCVRTASVTAPAVPPLVVFVAGLLVTASRPEPRLPITAAVLLAVLVLLLLRSNRLGAASHEGIETADADAVGLDLAARRWHSTMARVAFGLPAVAAVTALAVLAAWLLPIADGSDRADPRTLRDQPYRLAETLSPLVQLRPQLTGPRTELFTVTVDDTDGGDTRPDRVRTAALDTFDGALWTGTRDFQVTGTTLPPAPLLPPGPQPVPGPLVVPGQRVRLEVEVDRLVQPFLPVVGDPVRIEDAAGFAYDRATGTAVSTAGTGPFRYVTVGEVRPQDAATRQAVAAADPAATVLPAAPPWVRDLADLAVQDRQTPMSQLLAIEDMLRKQAYSAQALPGHSYGALKRVLLGVPADRVGNAEQYAAAFAVLARSRGYPARVAVGYQLRPEQRDGDTYTVYTADAHAWPEVRMQGYGWVAFEPTDARSPVAPQPPRSPDVTLGAADLDTPVAAAQPPPPVTVALVASRIGLGLLALLGLGVLLGVLVALVKVLRRRRRARRGPPAQRVVAAWAEVVDRLQDAGLRVPVSRTTTEVAADARRSPTAVAASPALDALAPLVASAIYAADEPTEQTAHRAWDLATEVRGHVDRSLGLGGRLRTLVDPRSLLPAVRRPAVLRRRGPAMRTGGRPVVGAGRTP